MNVEQESARPAGSVGGEDTEYGELREGLARAISRICPPWLAASREDLVQAALIKVMELRRRGEGSGGFASSYLWKVAHSALVDEIRRRRRRREQPLDDEPPGAEPAVGDPGPEERALGGELGRAIRWCLEKMVRPRRQAVTLHLQGHRVKETASLMGWAVKRADNLIYRGLQDLRACLEAKGLGP
jgi:RNA polymerase sigma-70 factor (ECF subfamily)